MNEFWELTHPRKEQTPPDGVYGGCWAGDDVTFDVNGVKYHARPESPNFASAVAVAVTVHYGNITMKVNEVHGEP